MSTDAQLSQHKLLANCNRELPAYGQMNIKPQARRSIHASKMQSENPPGKNNPPGEEEDHKNEEKQASAKIGKAEKKNAKVKLEEHNSEKTAKEYPQTLHKQKVENKTAMKKEEETEDLENESEIKEDNKEINDVCNEKHSNQPAVIEEEPDKQSQTTDVSETVNDEMETHDPIRDHKDLHWNRTKPEETKQHNQEFSDESGEEEKYTPEVKHKQVEEKETEYTNIKHIFYYIVITLVAVPGFAYLIYYYCIQKSENEAIPSVPQYDILKNEVDKLEQLFQSQDGEMWNIVQVSLEEIMYQPRPPKPAVLLIAYSSEGTTTVECLEHKLAELASKLLRSSIYKIYISQLNLNDPNKAKLQLDEKLKQGFESGSRVLLIHDLNLLPAETALLLHGYADNENAPYKKAVIIFSCEIPSADSLKDGDSSLDESLFKNELVNDYLKTIWEGYLGPSKAQALVSRVAWNTLFVHPEREIPPSCSKNLG